MIISSEDRGINIMSYNVLHPEFAIRHKQRQGMAADGSSNWLDTVADDGTVTAIGRVSQLAENVCVSGADIVCLQELGPKEQADLIPRIQALRGSIQHRYASHPRGDGVAILWDSEKLEFNSVTTLDKDAAIALGNLRFIRVDLTDRASGTRISVLSCHILGGADRSAGERQVEALRIFAEKPFRGFEPNYIAIAGDFNDDRIDAKRITELTGNGYRWDGVKSSTETDKNRRIDWIFVRTVNDVHGSLLKHLEINQPHPNASDHLATMTAICPILTPEVIAKPPRAAFWPFCRIGASDVIPLP